ncbi:MAG: hypothetical protein J0L92_09725 [Deltaproteobacteria bacterium]|nr:hypothetical protein [Deltaproteobacteria bacterium]
MVWAPRWMLFITSSCAVACGTSITGTDAEAELFDAGTDARATDASRPRDADTFDVASPIDAWLADDSADGSGDDAGRDAAGGPACVLESADAAASVDVEVEDAGVLAWRSESALRTSDAAPRYLGWSAALSADGRRAILGAPFDDTPHGEHAGTARVFVSREGVWEARLFAADGVADERLGYSVALSADGERAIVGSVPRDPGERGRGHVFLRSGTTWAREATLTAEDSTSSFGGVAVAMTGGGCRALIAVERSAEGPSEVLVFARIGSTWILDGSLISREVSVGFGASVGFDGAGERAIVGAPGDDTPAGVDAGSARVFVRGPGGWLEEARLIPSLGQAAAAFGRSVSMSSDGRWVVVGAEMYDEGALVDVGRAWIFRREDSGWIEDATLRHPDPDVDAYFGNSVSIDAQGDRALVGARYDDTPAGMHAGSARVFVRAAGVWRAEAALFDPAGAANDSFGRSVALSAHGELALVSAFYAESTAGTAHVFQLSR